MVVKDSKWQAFSSVVWKFMERVCAQGISVIVAIVLARLLSPDEYSVVSIVAIFFSFANILISGGLNTALIQKKDADEEDYSSVLLLSIAIAVALYTLLFALAPAISRLYSQELLIPIIRVMALSLPIYAVKSVYCAYISATMQFRKFFWATLGGTLASAVVGISMALNGFGAWALVCQQVSNTLIDTVILVISTKLRLPFKVSASKLAKLYSYGWKILASSFLGTLYNEAIPLIIGVKFSTTNLSYYTKGKSFPLAISGTTTSTLSAVLFPVLAKQQDDKARLVHYTRRFMQLASFVVFPVMLGFFAVADQFVVLLLTEKWLPAAYYIRVFCVVYMFDVVHYGNCETIKAMGRSDVYLIMEVIKKTSYFAVIGFFVYFGQRPQTLAWASIVCTAVAVVVNSIPNRTIIGYSYRQQAEDLLPNLLQAAAMCSCVLLIGRLRMNTLLLIVLQVLGGAAVYVLLSIVTHNQNFRYLLEQIKNRRNA